jgi:hypothetical protein
MSLDSSLATKYRRTVVMLLRIQTKVCIPITHCLRPPFNFSPLRMLFFSANNISLVQTHLIAKQHSR